MDHPGPTDLILIRHAPAQNNGRLAGRRDVAALMPDAAGCGIARAALDRLCPAAPRLLTSPARRCRDTARALFPGLTPAEDPRLWEQDFGDWDGQDPASLPDLGPLSRAELAAHRPPGGESFLDLCARCRPALLEAAGGGGTVLIFAHAGTIRAALGLALGQSEAGLGFEIAPLSATHLRALPGGNWSIAQVNRSLT
ncbi:histidine phosphatase family protein [Thioclava sp. BHET1]|nr:histidine phosphatase family protein [Thioclava sp. BHET1]